VKKGSTDVTVATGVAHAPTIFSLHENGGNIVRPVVSSKAKAMRNPYAYQKKEDDE
jgi:hypothetical protein